MYAADEDSMTVVGLLDSKVTIDGAVTVSRKMPLMDFVIENDNRLSVLPAAPMGRSDGHRRHPFLSGR